MEPFLDFYRCSEDAVSFTVAADLSDKPGYFQFDPDVVCFGQCPPGYSSPSPDKELYDLSPEVSFSHGCVRLPFDPAEVIDNLRLERYMSKATPDIARRLVRSGYYRVRPLLSVGVRKRFQRLSLRGWDRLPFPRWPVDTTVEQIFEKLMVLILQARQADPIPFIWFWPDGAPSCVMMTHDVETKAGMAFSSKLMDIDEACGIPACFQIVPEKRYRVTQDWLNFIRKRGFEVNVQDLNHDGRLFANRDSFLARAESINQYILAYGARGFRSAVMYRNPEWFEALEISYDMSIPNNAHLEPQRGGCCTVFPYFIGRILELPLTTTQDYSLFHILGDYSIELWQRQIAAIQERHGLISFIIHPDYMIPERARTVYRALLDYLADLRAENSSWFAFPGEVNDWWRARAQMRLVLKDGQWTVEGPDSDRARVAFARLENNRLNYAVTKSCSAALAV